MGLVAHIAIRCLMLSLIAMPSVAVCQISPGELSAAHASLEGISNCTACHTLGKTIDDNRCLGCHMELSTRIADGTGFHGRLRGKHCVECHKEHFGRSFSLVRFNPKTFDHASIGFRLEGKHAALECETCHTAKHIAAKDVQKNAQLMAGKTYLGLSQECRTCHEDKHRGQLSAQCQQCHVPEGWKPAARFVHDTARFRLTGKHTTVECARCHTGVLPDGNTVKYTGLDFSSCSSCHTDPHKGRFQKSCESCHNTGGWLQIAAGAFNHGTTRFPLRGKHASLKCGQCHRATSTGTGQPATRGFAIARFQRCADCHRDPHRGKFSGRADGGACESCHTENGFSPSTFAHSTAKFTLEGKHAQVPCAKCHPASPAGQNGVVTREFKVKKFQRCADCHADAHAGQFAYKGDSGDCEECHTINGFLPPAYTQANHSKARFALTGSHVAVPCAKCHPADAVRARSTRRFVWSEVPQCEACHRDVHGGQFSAAKYVSCGSCHAPEAWNRLVFAHDKTSFPLTGKHAAVECVRCHPDRGTEPGPGSRRFAGTPTKCSDCHTASSNDGGGLRRTQ